MKKMEISAAPVDPTPVDPTALFLAGAKYVTKNNIFKIVGQFLGFFRTPQTSQGPPGPPGGCSLQPISVPTTACLAGAKYVTKNRNFGQF